MDGCISVSLRCKFEIVVVVSQMYMWMDRRMNG